MDRGLDEITQRVVRIQAEHYRFFRDDRCCDRLFLISPSLTCLSLVSLETFFLLLASYAFETSESSR